MRTLLILLSMLACFAMGPQNPLFFLGAILLFVWLVVAILVGSVRWLLGLTAPWPAPGGAGAGPIGRTRICPDSHCGRVNTGQARFCAQCGRRLA